MKVLGLGMQGALVLLCATCYRVNHILENMKYETAHTLHSVYICQEFAWIEEGRVSPRQASQG